MKSLTLKSIFAFCILHFVVCTFLNAQIVYTDVNPDSTLSNPGNYYLDLNNDGQTDFIFYSHHSILGCPCSSGSRDTVTITTSSVSWVSDTLSGKSAKLNAGDSINSSSPLWTNAPNQILKARGGFCGGSCLAFHQPQFIGSSPVGIWWNAVDKYLALTIQVAGSIYYGWARLDVGSSVTIKDYAYNSIPDQFILAGDIGTLPSGISESIVSSSINLYPNPANNHLTITLGSMNKKVEVTITDITGKTIYATNARETQKIEVSTKDFSSGVYFVHIQSAENLQTEKLVVTK